MGVIEEFNGFHKTTVSRKTLTTLLAKAEKEKITKVSARIIKLLEFHPKEDSFTIELVNLVKPFGLNAAKKTIFKSPKLSNYTIANNCTDLTDVNDALDEIMIAIDKFERFNKKVPNFYYSRIRNLEVKKNVFKDKQSIILKPDLKKTILPKNRKTLAKNVFKNEIKPIKTVNKKTALKKPISKNLAPNGKPSLLTATQHKQVRTPAFKKWFGDWENDLKNASEVLDKNGEPLVVYHGTEFDFNTFDATKSNTGDYNFYFSSKITVAKKYGSKILSFFLKIKNPNCFDAKNNGFNDSYDNGLGNLLYNVGKVNDGLIVENIYDDKSGYKKGVISTVFVIPNENQIKSATNNNGNFNNKKISFLGQPKIINNETLNVNSLAYRMQNKTNEVHEYYIIHDKEISEFIGKIEKKKKESVAITLAAPQGGMKTRHCFQLMNAFAKNYKVGHASIEEHPLSSLYEDKIDEYLDNESLKNISSPEIKNIDDVHKLVRENDVIFIDSFSKLKKLQSSIKLDEDFRKKYDGKLFIIIYQLTTDGKMRGGSESQFDGDCIGFIEKKPNYKDNYVWWDKNRYQKTNLEELKFNIFSKKIIRPEKPKKIDFNFKIS
jgi:ADP-Ribosyltransferase in polyvalent proteins